MVHYKVPGLSVAVINDYRLDWIKGYGVIEAGSKTPVTSETYFEAASTTKLLTSAAAIHFVQQELLMAAEDKGEYL